MAKVSDAHLEARRRSIIDAACHVFSSKGIEQATMAEVAAEAGISPGAIYRYFANKGQLALGCLSEKSEAIEAQWESLDATPPDDPLGAFLDLSRVTFGALDDPMARIDTMLAVEQMLLTARGHADDAVKVMRSEFPAVVDGIAQRLKQAQALGQLPKNMDVAALAGGLFSFYWGERITRMLEPDSDSMAHLTALTQLLNYARSAAEAESSAS